MKSEMISPQEEKQHVPPSWDLKGVHLLKATTKLCQIVDLLCCRVGERGGKKRTPKGMEPLGVGRHMQLKHKHTGLCLREMY